MTTAILRNLRVLRVKSPAATSTPRNLSGKASPERSPLLARTDLKPENQCARLAIACAISLVAFGCKSSPEQSAAPSAVTANAAAPVAAAPLDKSSLLGSAGVPTYPGAKQLGSAVSPEEAGATHFTVMLSTSDSVDKAVAFYKDQLKFPGSARGDQYQLVGRTKEGADVLMFFVPQDNETHITVKGILYSKKTS